MLGTYWMLRPAILDFCDVDSWRIFHNGTPGRDAK